MTHDPTTGGHRDPNAFPPPDGAASRHGERVCARLRAEIESAGGAISFARYMELALYAPGLGYYAAGTRKFGEGGDFVTAPELSPLFSHCLARQCRQVLDGLGAGAILEFGAGSGVMAADILAELERLGGLPARYQILELSADLRARQGETLAARVPHLLERVVWLDRLPDAFAGVVLANEVLDAMPVHRFGVEAGQDFEWYVGWEDDGFVWRRGPLSDARLAARITALRGLPGVELPERFESEINLAAEDWMRSVAAILHSGMALIIDYGYPRREYYHPQRAGGTLMCHYRQRAHPDPLILAGLQDITAHVDFTAVAEAAVEGGLDVAGYTTQAHFLLACGLGTVLAELAGDDPVRHMELAAQVKRLTLPSQMGELFKVLALTRGFDAPLLGFSLRDLRGGL